MGVYNLNLEGTMPPTVLGGTVVFYENIDSLVTIIDKYEELHPRYTRFDTIIAEYPWGKEECYISYIK